MQRSKERSVNKKPLQSSSRNSVGNTKLEKAYASSSSKPGNKNSKSKPNSNDQTSRSKDNTSPTKPLVTTTTSRTAVAAASPAQQPKRSSIIAASKKLTSNALPSQSLPPTKAAKERAEKSPKVTSSPSVNTGTPVYKPGQVLQDQSNKDSENIAELDNYDYDEEEFEEDYQSDFEADEEESQEDSANRDSDRSSTSETSDGESETAIEVSATASSKVDTKPSKGQDMKGSGLSEHPTNTSKSGGADNSHKASFIPESPQVNREHDGAIKQRASTTDEKGVSKSTFLSIAKGFELSELKIEQEKKLSRSKLLKGHVKLSTVPILDLHFETSSQKYLSQCKGPVRLDKETQPTEKGREESTQTSYIEQRTIWTQKPPTLSMTVSEENALNTKRIREEAWGFGYEKPKADIIDEDPPSINWNKLSNFVSRASKKVLYALELKKRLIIPEGTNSNVSEIKMNRNLSVLSKLEMSCLLCEGDFLACSNGTHSGKRHSSKNLITIWSLKEPSIPMYFLRVWGQVEVIHLSVRGHLVAAGSNDGSISVWDLDEDTYYHTMYQDQFIRTPSVITSCMPRTHLDKVVGISMLHQDNDSYLMLSMDQSGALILWGLIRGTQQSATSDFPTHTSAWSKLNISFRTLFSIPSLLKSPVLISSLLAFKGKECNEFICATSSGVVVRGELSKSNDNVKLTTSKENFNSRIPITTMDISKLYDLLLVGFIDGICRLYSLENGLECIFSILSSEVPIAVKWSGRRGSVFYVATKGSVAVWDFRSSDIKPWKIINVEDLGGFSLFSNEYIEFTVMLIKNELKISQPVGNLKPLTEMEHQKLQTYFGLLLQKTMSKPESLAIRSRGDEIHEENENPSTHNGLVNGFNGDGDH